MMSLKHKNHHNLLHVQMFTSDTRKFKNSFQMHCFNDVSSLASSTCHRRKFRKKRNVSPVNLGKMKKVRWENGILVCRGMIWALGDSCIGSDVMKSVVTLEVYSPMNVIVFARFHRLIAMIRAMLWPFSISKELWYI